MENNILEKIILESMMDEKSGDKTQSTIYEIIGRHISSIETDLSEIREECLKLTLENELLRELLYDIISGKVHVEK